MFLVGVVYQDADGDGAYDPGEGVAGHHIVPELGGVYATSSASGGYAIPFLPDFGAVKVQWQGVDGTVRAEVEVTLAAHNQKLDFVIPPEPPPNG